MKRGAGEKFAQLVNIMEKLRSPSGCPWDRQQTHASLRRYLLEEAYEVIDTIDRGDLAHLKEELGDLILQIVFHAEIASEDDHFDISDVLESITDKLKRRHPHIFGETTVSSAEEVAVNWEDIKRRERDDESAIDGIPAPLPALLYAYRLQKKAAAVGFDWERIEDVIDKVKEELDELELANEPDFLEDELGDILFSLVNLGRHKNIDPEQALKRVCRKFETRFRYMESEAKRNSVRLSDMTLADMDKLWDEAKNKEQNKGQNKEK